MAIILNPLQKEIFSIVASEPEIQKEFYFTGGTALSECYLQHRESVDIDLFSEKPISRDMIARIEEKLVSCGIQIVDIRKIHDRFTLEAKKSWSPLCIIDFCYYQFPRIRPSNETFLGISVDSLYDIWVNKWFVIFDRNEVKDILDIVAIHSLKWFGVSDQDLEDVAKDIWKKFHFSCKARALKDQFLSRLSRVHPEKYSHIMYKDIWNFNIVRSDWM